jgi:protein-tyrosine kinase
MDLRQSIEKAKKMREEAKLAASTSPPGVSNTSHADGWVSPEYCDSCPVELDQKAAERNRCVCLSTDGQELTHYKLLRTQIQQRCKANNWNTLMVTSVLPGEGKTLTTINLALSFAKEFNRTVLLVDCDLKRQNVHKYLGIESSKGLGLYLMNGTPLKDLILWPGVEKLTLISGGRSVPESTELLGSPKMKALVSEMKARYPDRMILFDVPPLLSEADAMAFAPLVDGILMVVESRRTSIQDIQKAMDLIPREKLLGFVLNRQKAPHKDYYYYRSY